MSEKARARIEAEFSDRRESPDPDGDNHVDITIPGAGLETSEVEEVDYVVNLIDKGTEYHVYVKADYSVYISST